MTTAERVLLHPLTFVPDGDQVVVGRPDIESYAVFPVDGAELLRRLSGGSTLAEAAAWYEATYAEPVDVEDFLDTLRDLGFARDRAEPAGEAGGAGTAAAGPVPLQRLGRAVFSPVAAVLYGALVAVTVAAMWRLPEVRLSPSHVFFTGSLVAIQLTLVLAELPLIFLHESAHVLAGRRLGLTSRLGIGRRLYFVVFETTLTKLLSVPRRKRYLPLLAGLLTDVGVLCLLVLVAVGTRDPAGGLPLAGRLALALAYLTVIRIAWQFLFFMETDVHHLLATVLRVTDLRGMTDGYLRDRFRRLLRRPAGPGPALYLSDRDRAVLRWFGPLTLAASLVLTALAVGATVPVLVGYLVRVGDGLATGATDGDFWTTVVSLLLLFVQVGVLAVLAARDRRAVRRAARRAGGAEDNPTTVTG